MSVKLMGQVWELDLDHAKLIVMLAMADYSDDDGLQCYPSMDHLAWKTGYSTTQVRRIVQGLTDDGLLYPLGDGVGGRGNSNQYWVRVDKGKPKPPLERTYVTPALRDAKILENDTTCQYCGHKGDLMNGPDGQPWEIDRMPGKRGNKYTHDNTVLSCGTCNRKKPPKRVVFPHGQNQNDSLSDSVNGDKASHFGASQSQNPPILNVDGNSGEENPPILHEKPPILHEKPPILDVNPTIAMVGKPYNHQEPVIEPSSTAPEKSDGDSARSNEKSNQSASHHNGHRRGSKDNPFTLADISTDFLTAQQEKYPHIDIENETERALNHKSVLNVLNVEQYLRNWYRNSEKYRAQRNDGARNGGASRAALQEDWKQFDFFAE